MAQWKNTDSAANSVLWAVEQYNKKANSVNQTAFYGNTTADSYVTGVTVGQFGISESEAAQNPVSHAGWVVKTTGSGGRAGRVSYETLVAMSSISGDGDSLPPPIVITISGQPANDSANSSANEIATFGVTATAPSGTLSYVWQKYGGAAFANLTNSGAYSNVTTSTLSVLSNTASTGEVYRVVITNSLGGTATSANATLTVTT